MQLDYNILAYLIYLPIMVLITVKVGAICHRNGEVWTMELYQDEEFVKAVNRLLLLAYYLLNVGYVVFVISFWETVEDLEQLVSSITIRAGAILLSLALLHYLNIGALTLWYNLKYKPLKT